MEEQPEASGPEPSPFAPAEHPTTPPPAVPQNYEPPTTDGTGFIEWQRHAKQPMHATELSFDIEALTWEQRRDLSYRLTQLNVKHRVEGAVLIADLESATAVQGQLDELLAVAPEAEPTDAEPGEAEPVRDEIASSIEYSATPLRFHDDPVSPVEEVNDWIAPPPVEPAPIVDEPVVARDESEEIVVPPSTDIDAVIEATAADEEAEGEDDEIVFDLLSLSTEERRHLSMRLTGAGISHIWEVATDLVVSVKDAPLIERYIQEVQNPDGFADEEMAQFESDEDVDDEEIYAAMSGLYVASDKLMQRAKDPSVRTAFYDAVDDVDGLPAPFGFDPRVWTQVQELANHIADAMDAEADDDDVANDARTLRQLLVNYV